MAWKQGYAPGEILESSSGVRGREWAHSRLVGGRASLYFVALVK